MIKGIYTAASSMLTKQLELNTVANNLANVNSPGFKKDSTVQKSFSEMLLLRMESGKRSEVVGSLGTGVSIDDNYTDFSQGLLKDTGNNLDLAIEGSGFFVIQTPGGLTYTRDGSFTLNDSGQIVTQQGYPVLGERGPLQAIAGRDIKIDEEGRLHFGNIRGDRIQIVDFAETERLTKKGNNLYSTDNIVPNQADNYILRQGFLENSNVNIVSEMVKMIETNRMYEANQKVITTMDNTLDKAVNRIARIG